MSIGPITIYFPISQVLFNDFPLQKMTTIVGSSKTYLGLLQTHDDYFTIKHYAGNVSPQSTYQFMNNYRIPVLKESPSLYGFHDVFN